MLPVLEAVPNFSEGRDLDVVRALVGAVRSEGADVLDWSADADHHRSVVTFVGDPATVERAALAAAAVAVEAIDLREHRGAHPRVGALDVLPFVPLRGLEMADAVASARRVAGRLGETGLPAYLYGAASTPPGRGLAELRRGGFEALAGGLPRGREPDVPGRGLDGLHPTAGIACVGARPLLLAWNVDVEGLDAAAVRALAAGLRESGGGVPGLRALGLELPRQGRLQLSMNLEDVERRRPFDVFRRIEREVEARGGRVVATEVVGMAPDTLLLPAAAHRLSLRRTPRERWLSAALVEHLSRRLEAGGRALRAALDGEGEAVPEAVRRAALDLLEGRTDG